MPCSAQLHLIWACFWTIQYDWLTVCLPQGLATFPEGLLNCGAAPQLRRGGCSNGRRELIMWHGMRAWGAKCLAPKGLAFVWEAVVTSGYSSAVEV
jgi:hypothetical protein